MVRRVDDRTPEAGAKSTRFFKEFAAVVDVGDAVDDDVEGWKGARRPGEHGVFLAFGLKIGDRRIELVAVKQTLKIEVAETRAADHEHARFGPSGKTRLADDTVPPSGLAPVAKGFAVAMIVIEDIGKLHIGLDVIGIERQGAAQGGFGPRGVGNGKGGNAEFGFGLDGAGFDRGPMFERRTRRLGLPRLEQHLTQIAQGDGEGWIDGESMLDNVEG